MAFAAADLSGESSATSQHVSCPALKLYHLADSCHGDTGNILANRQCRARRGASYADFAQSLIAIARPLYVDEPFGIDLKSRSIALDATTIDLCLSVFSWAPFRSTKAAIKLHTLLDLRGNISDLHP